MDRFPAKWYDKNPLEEVPTWLEAVQRIAQNDIIIVTVSVRRTLDEIREIMVYEGEHLHVTIFVTLQRIQFRRTERTGQLYHRATLLCLQLCYLRHLQENHT